MISISWCCVYTTLKFKHNANKLFFNHMCVCTHTLINFYFTAVQDDAFASNGNKDSLSFDGMADAEVEKRLKVTITSLSSGWMHGTYTYN